MTISQHERDLYCLKNSGYIVLRGIIENELVMAIEKSCIAFENEIELFKQEEKVILSHSWPLRTTRCLYAVSKELQDFIMLERIQKLVHDYLDVPILRDSLMQTNMPDSHNVKRGLNADISFHRDTLWGEGQICPQYLHVFLLLTDFTAESGATFVVPGSHREKEPGYYFKNSDPRKRQEGIDYRVYEQCYFPSALQILAPRGSVILMDPMMIHSQGINVTQYPRRLINSTFRSSKIKGQPQLLNAQAIARKFSRVPVRKDLFSILENDDSLPGEYGPLRDNK